MAEDELQVPEELFKDVKYYPVGELDPKVVQMLKAGKAKEVSYNALATHIIAEEGDNPEVSEAREVFDLPIVKPSWVTLSVRCGVRLPENGFSPESCQIFFGVTACLSQVSPEDRNSLWALTTFHGGDCQLSLNKKCTHLIVPEPKGNKYEFAYQRESIKIVTPDWVVDSISEKNKKDEALYHPRLIVYEEEEEEEDEEDGLNEDQDSNASGDEDRYSSKSSPVSSRDGSPGRSADFSPKRSSADKVKSELMFDDSSDSSPEKPERNLNWTPAEVPQVNTAKRRLPQGKDSGLINLCANVPPVPGNILPPEGRGNLLSSVPGMAAPERPDMMGFRNPAVRTLRTITNNAEIQQINRPSNVAQILQTLSASTKGLEHQVNHPQQGHPNAVLFGQVKSLTPETHLLQQSHQTQQQQPHHPLVQLQPQQLLQLQQQQQQQQINQQAFPQHQFPQVNQPHHFTQLQFSQQQLHRPQQQQQTIQHFQQQHALQQQLHQLQQQQHLQQQQQQQQQTLQQQQNLQQILQQQQNIQQTPQQQAMQQQQPVLQPNIQQQQALQQNILQSTIQQQQTLQTVIQQQNIKPGMQPQNQNLQSIQQIQQQQNLQQMQHLTLQQKQQLQHSLQQQQIPSHGLQQQQQIQTHGLQQQQLQQQQLQVQSLQQQQIQSQTLQQQQHQMQAQTLQQQHQIQGQALQQQTNTIQSQNLPQQHHMQAQNQQQQQHPIQAQTLQQPHQIQSQNLQLQHQIQAQAHPQHQIPPQMLQQQQQLQQQNLQLQQQQMKQQQMQQNLQQQQHLQQQQIQQSQMQQQQTLQPSQLQQVSMQQQQIQGALQQKPSLQQLQQIQQQQLQRLQQQRQLQNQSQQLQMTQRLQNQMSNHQTPQLHQLHGHDPSLDIPEDYFLLGCVFAIADYPEQMSDKQLLATWKRAMKERKRCITAHWLNAVLKKKKMVPPHRALHFPVAFPPGGKPCSQHIVSVTGFVDSDRDELKLMAYLAGAKYTGYLCRSNTVLICKEPSGLKYEKAKEWRIPCVNALWLCDILLGNFEALRQIQHSRYTVFNLQDPLAPSPHLVSDLLEAWRMPLKVSSELLMSIRIPLKPKQNEPVVQPKRARIEDLPPPTKKLSPDLTPHVMFTGFDPQQVQQYVKKLYILGGEVAESAQKCTHLVASKVTRTVKFLTAISIAKHIVTPEWLDESFKCQKFVEEQSYILRDAEAEVLFCFSLEESLKRARVTPLLKAKYFYITPGICPSLSTMKAIVESAGGKILTKQPSFRKIMEHKQNKSLAEIILISCENDLHLCREYFASNIDVHNAEFVLTGVLTQTLDYESYKFT
uniref:PAX-interacting protein 1 n=1 Tax=Leptobrachium leishanense TaxID=445787 RepID=A0A8C5Q044_9ANUR